MISKTGLSEAHARLAVETVLSLLKSKLPAPVAYFTFERKSDALLGFGSSRNCL